MNALLHRVAAAVRDRAVELGAVGTLLAATVGLTWWFTAPLGFAIGWWIAAELRLRRARRANPGSTTRGEPPTAHAVSSAAVSPTERVSAGQQVEGRAGA
ncbi:hypothetical protein [Pseudonocardia sp. ICBG1142]|uniref:hypothetical protein n=1 Tax=Pseudonocardia sp. ICBG1142 TaxID=2846760 RepID=UPI001CF6486B|nr:hypothetical protein [Pseudonocardia sp. ICBG1142]